MASLRARTIFSDPKLTVTAVESIDFLCDQTPGGHFIVGSLKPIAVIVKKPDETFALDMSGQPFDIGQLELPPEDDAG